MTAFQKDGDGQHLIQSSDFGYFWFKRLFQRKQQRVHEVKKCSSNFWSAGKKNFSNLDT